ncbi:type 4b pilus protein PilO2 [Collimonas humicola]|uniref:type 4b pilus protein PilO2 n=1 Tax=Collimonas humicola TaxID=2825886 RepID=UPI001B8CCD56|nr:type 4b pilus protein PilO2 [Collimonas humicola]
MAIHITQIGKYKFACGLFWQSLSRPRELVKEAAELARKIDSDLMVLRKDHATAQAGFAHSREGASRATYSLGAAVSKTLALEGANYDGQKQTAHNWLGAFKLADGMWAYFAVRDANFLPNGDFAGSKEEVLERLQGDYGLGGWNVVIGEAELADYGFHNFNPRKIEDLIPRKKCGEIRVHAWWALRPVKTTIAWKPAAAIGSLSIVLAGAGYLYWQHLKQEEQRRQFALEAARQKSAGAAALPHPWRSLPVPASLAQACFNKFSHLTAGGWQLDDYSCNVNSASYSWSRQDSTIDFLRVQVPAAQVDLSGNKASFAEPLKTSSGQDETLLDIKNILEPLASRLQLMHIAAKIAKVPSPPENPAGQPKDAPKPDWESYTFAFNSGALPPSEVARILGQPGIRLNKLSYHGGNWSFEGVMYAKLP